MRKKQQTTEHEDSHDHIISHHAPAALLRAEKNIIKLGSNVCVCVCIYIYIHIYRALDCDHFLRLCE